MVNFLENHKNINQNNWLDTPLSNYIPWKLETLLVILLLALAVVSRFYDLGARAMSHDEVNHVVPSYDFYQGGGFRYDPVSHGPLQFHLIAFSYFLFGDSDFTSRIPAALFSVATVALGVLIYRRYLGRAGALAAGFLFLISPFMLFYGRYARNEAFIVLWGLLTIYAILRYLERGERKILFLFTLINAFHFTDKATSYIFAAEQLIFLFGYLVDRITRKEWPRPLYRRIFLLGLIAVVVLVAGAAGIYLTQKPLEGANRLLVLLLGGAGLAAGVAALAVLWRGLGWAIIRSERSFDLLLLLGTLVLPLLAALPVKLAGSNPLDYSTAGISRAIVWIALLALPAIGIGLWWNRRLWPILAGMFYTVFITFYSTFFSNPEGVAGGFMGALGYWMEQQSVNRGGQPWYYYGLFLVPIYEFLPAMGMLVAVIMAWRKRLWLAQPGQPFQSAGRKSPWDEAQQTNRGMESLPGDESPGYAAAPDESGLSGRIDPNQLFSPVDLSPGGDNPTADELPQISLGMTFPPGDGANQTNRDMASSPGDESPGYAAAPDESDLSSRIDPGQRTGPFDLSPGGEVEVIHQPVPTLALIFFWSLSSLATFSFAGEKMPWLTIHIALPLILGAAWGLGYLIESVHWDEVREQRGWLAALLLVVFMAALREAISGLAGSSAFVTGAALDRILSISGLVLSLFFVLASGVGLAWLLKKWKTIQILSVFLLTGFAFLAVLTIRTAYRAAFIYEDDPLEYMVYAHGAPDPKRLLDQVEEISRMTTGGLDLEVAYDNNVRYSYWWYLRHYPNRVDYGETPTREIRNAPVIFVGAENYAKVAPIVRQDYLEFEYMRMWWPNQDYWSLKWDQINAERTKGLSPELVQALPPMQLPEYLERVWGHIKPFFTDPRVRSAIIQIWLNRDYREYAALKNSQSFDLANWSPADRMRMYIRKDVAAKLWKYGVSGEQAQVVVDPYDKAIVKLSPERSFGTSGVNASQFQAPRGVALAPDGSLYVADSRNNRIQHLSPDGQLLHMWGAFADISQGAAPGGAFYEPWGVAVGPDGSVYVTDTWNHRVEKFTADGQFLLMWGYFGQGERPEAFWGPRGIAVDANGNVYVVDTGNKRIVIFDAQGQYITQFGGKGSEPGKFDEPVGVALDVDGNVYVADTWNQRVQVFAPDEANPKNYIVIDYWDVAAWFGQSLDNKPFIAVDARKHVYVSDPEGCRVLEFSFAGAILHAWGECSAEPGGMNLPTGLVLDGTGGVWVSDAANNRLLRFLLPTP